MNSTLFLYVIIIKTGSTGTVTYCNDYLFSPIHIDFKLTAISGVIAQIAE
ncbi:hypothetical protein [Segetibacter koreensis]|nr:hypothetical protein [Segetibacter koreensis]